MKEGMGCSSDENGLLPHWHKPPVDVLLRISPQSNAFGFVFFPLEVNSLGAGAMSALFTVVSLEPGIVPGIHRRC